MASPYCAKVGLVRTAGAVQDAAFVGPDKSDTTYFDRPGKAFEVLEPGFIQYRVTLKTDNPALTPYVKRVIISYEE